MPHLGSVPLRPSVCLGVQAVGELDGPSLSVWLLRLVEKFLTVATLSGPISVFTESVICLLSSAHMPLGSVSFQALYFPTLNILHFFHVTFVTLCVVRTYTLCVHLHIPEINPSSFDMLLK